jgi:hypothetical protein
MGSELLFRQCGHVAWQRHFRKRKNSYATSFRSVAEEIIEKISGANGFQQGTERDGSKRAGR